MGVRTVALLCLDTVSRVRTKVGEVTSSLSVSVNHGTLMSVLRRLVSDLQSDARESASRGRAAFCPRVHAHKSLPNHRCSRDDDRVYRRPFQLPHAPPNIRLCRQHAAGRRRDSRPDRSDQGLVAVEQRLSPCCQSGCVVPRQFYLLLLVRFGPLLGRWRPDRLCRPRQPARQAWRGDWCGEERRRSCSQCECKR